ncbi:MAG: PorP/SprF family type IX secretion system membrane protein [Prevotellaceae bacterium]|jgi:type IX secretion system PorP/SprF family membrane protein|nr:PorP/SprF family type IX secretion system membrane protein [Prevotellaceae bacterium]
MRFKYLILPVVIFFYGTVKSQSDFDLSQRWFNESIYNPGATGSSFSTGVFFHSRMQWIGTDGAPVTNAVSVDTYVDDMRSGFGLAVYTDKIGYMSSWSAKFAYAYYIRIGDKSSLALGLSGYLQNRNSHISPDMLDQSADPALSYSKFNEYNPNFDFGLEFKGPLKIGASVRHLLKYEAVNSFFTAQSMNFWSYASSRFNVSDGMSLEPVVSYMYRDNINRIEGGVIVYFLKSLSRGSYNDRFWLGGMYRLNKQFAVLVGANLTSKIRLGYSFDYGTGDLASISKMGTHELFLSWHFNRIFYKDPDCPAYRKSYGRR